MISTYKEYLETALGSNNKQEKIGCNNKKSFFIALEFFLHIHIFKFIGLLKMSN